MVWVKICGITNEEDAKYISGLGVDAIGFIFSSPSPRRVEVERAEKIISSLEGRARKSETRENRDREIRDEKGKAREGKAREGKAGEGRAREGRSRISIVGVFVNEKIEKVLDTAQRLCLDYIQLSGDEDMDYLITIRKAILKDGTREEIFHVNKKIIKSIRVGEGEESDECAGESMDEILYTLRRKVEDLKGVVDYFLLDSFKKNMYGGTGKSFRWDIVESWGEKYPIVLSGGLDFQNVREAIKIVKPYGVDASSKLEIYPGKKDWEKVEKFVETVKGRGEFGQE